jgi:hypothetical protein
MLEYRLPRILNANSNDPSWMRSLKRWCNDVTRILRILRQITGDGVNIIIDDNVIRFITPLQQFHPTLQGAETVKVTRGWVSVAGRGRWASPETSIILDGPSGWVVVRKDKSNPAYGAGIIVSPSGPNPVQETYYEWAVCSYTLDVATGRYSIADFSLGEKEWYATL